MKRKRDIRAVDMFKKKFFKYKKNLLEGIGATFIINILALATSLFSMQVYDRVIPTHGLSTLVTLSIAVIMMIIFEFSLKIARSTLMDNMTLNLDNIYTRNIYKRLLSVRLDQLPASIGSLSSQLKSYETIRGFLTSSTIFLFVDAPFALIYIFLLSFIASPWIAIVSLFFFLLSLIVGFYLKYKIKYYASAGAKFSNLRIGELVETIQGAEIIKSGNGENKFLSRWMRTSKSSILNDLGMKHISENSGYFSALLQQLGYASIVIVGAFLVIDGTMTMGALIASSIISGRVMSSVAALPGLFTQMAHSRAAIDGIEQMYALKTDHEDITVPLKMELIMGGFKIKDVEYLYNKTVRGLSIDSLEIKAGEKVAIIGSIGSGKSTLLKVLTGLYGVEQGNVFIDNLDIAHVDRSSLSKHIGYMPQDNRLFQGTIKENLIIGFQDPGVDVLQNICEQTGLINVINQHQKGFELPIYEGGVGLSSGQRQLVAITRLFLSNPKIWLLDEPTASMDGQLEMRTLQILQQHVQPNDTLIVVTHKPNILALVDRIIVMNNGQIYMDGKKEEVLLKLNSNN